METKLKRIEEELAGYIKVDQKNWTKIYQLMKEVQKGELYKERPDTKSFNAWVNALADDLKVHVSLLWARLKAGRVYQEYEDRAAKNGRFVTPMSSLSISPDSLNLCEKVAGKNALAMDELIDKVVSGELTREDLRAAAKAKRAAGGMMPVTRHDRIDADDRTELRTEVTASDIMLALRQPSWLPGTKDIRGIKKAYHMFSEFRIPSGTSRYVRRIDGMVAETYTVTNSDEIVLRGVEIKISSEDLLGDHKMQEYTDFCDYFYLAIPDGVQKIMDAALSISRPAWGILAVKKDGSIRVVRNAEKLDAIFRDKTMSNCIIKLI